MDEANDKFAKLNEITNDNELRIIYINKLVKTYILKFKSVFKILFFIFLCYVIFLSIIKKEKPFNYDDEFPQFINLGYAVFLSKEIIKKFNYYMDLCNQGILTDNATYNLSDSPKISVIIALYNGGKYLKYSLRSIQNQKLKDIEIILINDHSTDDTLTIVENYMKEDPRIRIINNEKNRRILFSKSLGALYANGEYIVELDQDDMFISNNAFSLLYNQAKKENLDLIQFQDFILREFHFKTPVRIGRQDQMTFHNEDAYLEQPEIKNNIFIKYNLLLWGLLIKSEIYKKVVNTLWTLIINYKLIHFEDYHITFIIAAYVKNFRFMNYYFIVHLHQENSAGNDKEFKDQQYLSQLFFVNSMIEYHIKNNPDDVSMLNMFIAFVKHFWKHYKIIHNNIYNFIIKKWNAYLTYEQKIYLRNKYKIKDFKLNNTYEDYISNEEFNSILSYQNLIKTKSKKNINNISLSPKYTIIVYSIETTFLKVTLNSIQNQNFDNFEIILICDNCHNLEEKNKLIQDYNNLKLIAYKDIKGLIYSYSEAVLKSKGEYILTIKSGYTFSTNDVLNKLNNYTNFNDDILEYNLLINNKESIDDNSLRLYRCEHFDSEVEFTSLIYNKDYKKIDQEKELLINKIIKTNIYKTIINENLLLYKDNIIYNFFDEILLFIFRQNNIKIKNVNFSGIIEYSKNIKSFKKFNDINDKSQIISDSLFYIEFLFNHTPNNEKDKMFVLNEFYNIMNIIYNKNNIVTEDGKKLIYKFLNCDCIPQYNKNLLKTYYNALIDRNKFDLIV